MQKKTTIENRVKSVFGDKFEVAEDDEFAFGMTGEEFCSGIEALDDIKLSERIKKINFSKDGSKGDVVMYDVNGLNRVIHANRRYSAGKTLTAIGFSIPVQGIGEEYKMYVASSEIARNCELAVYDLVVKIKNVTTGKEIVVPDTLKNEGHFMYGLPEKVMNWDMLIEFIADIKDKIAVGKGLDRQEIKKKMKEDERDYSVHFTNTNVTDLEDSVMREIVDKEFKIVPEETGFKLSFGKYTEGKGTEWNRHVFYHNVYEESEGIDKDIANLFEIHIEKDVFDILNLKEANPQKQLDACMMLFKNKQALEKKYPFDRKYFSQKRKEFLANNKYFENHVAA